jgi:signal transduction histidine kinase
VVRIVGEALANVLRHSSARGAEVRIERTGGAVVVAVRDPGPARARDTIGRDGTGGGVRGMRERANALGGAVVAGPDDRGGWRVRAALPCAPVPEAARL